MKVIYIANDDSAISFDPETDIAFGPVWHAAESYDDLRGTDWAMSAVGMAQAFWKWFLHDHELYDHHNWDEKRAEFMEHLKETA